MSLFRSLSATLLSAAATFSLVTSSGCGTNAVGVDDCREIERARCDAALPCGLIDDSGACKRYSRDHCLHGLLAKPPAGAVDECVRVIKAAGACAGSDPETALGDCDPEVTDPASGLATACDVVARPERAQECAFLLTEPPDDSGSGGQPATGEPTAGAASDPEQPAAGAGGQNQ